MENKEEKRLTLTNWIQILAILLMLISAVIVSFYLITEKINYCTASPLNYISNKISDDENVSLHHGVVYFYMNEFDKYPYKSITFNISS